MRFLLKTNQIILIKHIERLPYEATIQGIYSNEQQSDSKVRLCWCLQDIRVTIDSRQIYIDHWHYNDQLASFVGDKPANYKGGKSSKSFNDKLRATGEVSIQNKDSGKKDRTWTDYIFFPVSFGHYRRINREFYDSYNKTLDLKLRGFILKLFSAAEPHSHTITLPVRRMKELIHMGHGTISNYIEQLRDMDLLDEVGDTIILKAKGLIIDLPKDKYVEEVKADFEHMIAFNESRGNPISRECMIYKKYKENNFKGVKDMHALMKSLSSGLVGRKQEAKDKKELPDLIL